MSRPFGQTGVVQEGDTIIVEQQLVLDQGLYLGEPFQPPAWTADVIDFDLSTVNDVITGLPGDINKVGVLMVSSTTNIALHSIVAPSLLPPLDNKSLLFYIQNSGTKNIQVKNMSTSAGADEYKFDLGADVAMQGSEGILIIYNPRTARFTSAGKNI